MSNHTLRLVELDADMQQEHGALFTHIQTQIAQTRSVSTLSLYHWILDFLGSAASVRHREAHNFSPMYDTVELTTDNNPPSFEFESSLRIQLRGLTGDNRAKFTTAAEMDIFNRYEPFRQAKENAQRALLEEKTNNTTANKGAATRAVNQAMEVLELQLENDFEYNIKDCFHNINENILEAGIIKFEAVRGNEVDIVLAPFPVDFQVTMRAKESALKGRLYLDSVRLISKPPLLQGGIEHKVINLIDQGLSNTFFGIDDDTTQFLYTFSAASPEKFGLTRQASLSEGKNEKWHEILPQSVIGRGYASINRNYRALYPFNNTGLQTALCPVPPAGLGFGGKGRVDKVTKEEYIWAVVKDRVNDVLLAELKSRIEKQAEVPALQRSDTGLPVKTITHNGATYRRCNTPTKAALGSGSKAAPPFEIAYFRKVNASGYIVKHCKKNTPKTSVPGSLDGAAASATSTEVYVHPPRAMAIQQDRFFYGRLTQKNVHDKATRKATRRAMRSQGAFFRFSTSRRLQAGTVMTPFTQEASATRFLDGILTNNDLAKSSISDLKQIPTSTPPTGLLVETPVNQEWCHLLGHGDGGSEWIGNFVCGSYHCNTEQLAIESAIRQFSHLFTDRFQLGSTAYLLPNNALPKSNILNREVIKALSLKAITAAAKAVSTDASEKAAAHLREADTTFSEVDAVGKLTFDTSDKDPEAFIKACQYASWAATAIAAAHLSKGNLNSTSIILASAAVYSAAVIAVQARATDSNETLAAKDQLNQARIAKNDTRKYAEQAQNGVDGANVKRDKAIRSAFDAAVQADQVTQQQYNQVLNGTAYAAAKQLLDSTEANKQEKIDAAISGAYGGIDVKSDQLPQKLHFSNSRVYETAPVAAFIRYRIFMRDFLSSGASNEAAGAAAAATPKPEKNTGITKIFDYIFEGQSEFFDINQYHIVYFTVLAAVRDRVVQQAKALIAAAERAILVDERSNLAKIRNALAALLSEREYSKIVPRINALIQECVDLTK